MNSEISIINSETSIINTDPSIINTEPSIINTDPSIINSEILAVNNPTVNFFVASGTHDDVVAQLCLRDITAKSFDFGILFDNTGNGSLSINSKCKTYLVTSTDYYYLEVIHNTGKDKINIYSFMFVDIEKIFNGEIMLDDNGSGTEICNWLTNIVNKSVNHNHFFIVTNFTIFNYLEFDKTNKQLLKFLKLIDGCANNTYILSTDNEYCSSITSFKVVDKTKYLCGKELIFPGNINSILTTNDSNNIRLSDSDTRIFISDSETYSKTSGYMTFTMCKTHMLTNFNSWDDNQIENRIIVEICKFISKYEDELVLAIDESDITFIKKCYYYINDNCLIDNYKESLIKKYNRQKLLRLNLLKKVNEMCQVILCSKIDFTSHNGFNFKFN